MGVQQGDARSGSGSCTSGAKRVLALEGRVHVNGSFSVKREERVGDDGGEPLVAGGRPPEGEAHVLLPVVTGQVGAELVVVIAVDRGGEALAHAMACSRSARACAAHWFPPEVPSTQRLWGRLHLDHPAPSSDGFLPPPSSSMSSGRWIQCGGMVGKSVGGSAPTQIVFPACR